jgi:hypothetical protein
MSASVWFVQHSGSVLFSRPYAREAESLNVPFSLALKHSDESIARTKIAPGRNSAFRITVLRDPWRLVQTSFCDGRSRTRNSALAKFYITFSSVQLANEVSSESGYESNVLAKAKICLAARASISANFCCWNLIRSSGYPEWALRFTAALL